MKGASHLLVDLGHVSLGQENVTLGWVLLWPLQTMGWDQVTRWPRWPGQTEAWWIDRQGSRTGRGRRVRTHGRHRKEGSSLRPGAVAATVGAFSFPGCWVVGWRPQSPGHDGGSWGTPSAGPTFYLCCSLSPVLVGGTCQLLGPVHMAPNSTGRIPDLCWWEARPETLDGVLASLPCAWLVGVHFQPFQRQF
jgi:hypothetical protein